MPDEAVRIMNFFGTFFMLLAITCLAIAVILNVVKNQVNLNDIFKKIEIICAIVTPALIIISIMFYVFANIF
ncbi:hypothetical protein BU104_12630 [Staphylococcus xylosus]|uniref:Uncharacterized protein n=1 Tax=Staphylococcus xylosus TaxID=1288 RepID=A0AAQ0LVS2_STAXY|nr:hypothetical protein [Staphylococcus xylosus]RIM90972.1 hypothetical protein BU104_12630 [Staphylococcus xylosus]